ncbi:BZ3500_MvSof-1268-A1-R1_Chr3-1g05434 [Microbotryum saponariae]|uniref:BZ3500_MvSof-1268-A1-R1_Chr3-1g05434 protein n=1 Tax=Microbotryum saponariae TaxID=289078 RepID=A0A2X0N031_9BASI|nr:BZ3500_MvSof-1268-A1-R1_Chr3-1g05434 [Microbotryum saponariae]SDA04625.1 BZ3501_MvSof-1269-A2-R1_Chr3-1g05105 [Microbotryum saponariae]
MPTLSTVSRFLPSWSTVLVGLILNYALKTSSTTVRSQWLRRTFFTLLWLNWRSLPFIWHLHLFGQVPLLHLRLRLYGLDKVFAIAKDPFDTKVITRGTATWDASDWNMHLSNSSYAKACDVARFKWLCNVVGCFVAQPFGRMDEHVPDVVDLDGLGSCGGGGGNQVGPAFGREDIWSPLAQTAFYFHREIPIFASYEIDVHVVAWDDKWLYYVCRFTTPPNKKTSSSERTLNCVSLCRSCFKMKGSRLSIPPSRVLSISGVGPDRSNWDRAMGFRAEGKGKAWLKYGGELAAKKAGKLGTDHVLVGEEGWDEDGMRDYEERRIEGLKIVGRFGDVRGWENL